MPLPTSQDLHVNDLLTNLSVQFINAPTKFVSAQVFPVVPVQKQTDIYAVFDRGDFLRDEAQPRSPGDESAGGGYRVDTSNTYSCQVYAFHKDVPDETRNNYDQPFDPDRNATQFLTQKRQLREEVEWATKFFTTGIWTGSTTATDLVAGTDFTAWDDAASDIVQIIDDQAESIESNTAYYPNTLVLNRKGWNSMKNHPDIVDRVKHVSDGPVTTAIVAKLLGLERIIVGAAVKNTAQEGATTSVSYIFGNHALLCYAAPVAAVEMPSAGYTFRWTGMDGSQGGAAISTFRMDWRKQDRHEIEFAFQHKTISTIMGVFFQNVAS